MDIATVKNRTLLERDKWLDLAKKEGLPEDYLLLKGFSSEVKQESLEDRILRFIISDSSVDRDRDIIQTTGWQLQNFRKDPVVLWSHSHREPAIARALSVAVENEQLIARAEFIPGDINGFADMIFRMLVGGFLRATSVGFLPKEWSIDEERRGVNFIEQELLEFSIVNVPANPNALIAASASGIDLEPLAVWAEQTLDELYAKDGPGYLWFPKTAIERALQIADGSGGKLLISVPKNTDDGDAQVVADRLAIDVYRPEENGEGKVFEASKKTIEPEPTLPEIVTHDVGECGSCGDPHEQLEFRRYNEPKGDSTHWSTCPETEEPIELTLEMLDKGIVPRNVSSQTAPPDTAWSRPRLADFTAETFGELSATERRRVAGHFGWAAVMPPEKFGDLKLPHHRASDGFIVFRGVTAAMGVLLGARGGVDVPESDRRPIYNHLARHYRQFDKEPPEFRMIEAQVLRNLPELFELDPDSGELKQKFALIVAEEEPSKSEKLLAVIDEENAAREDEGFDKFLGELFNDEPEEDTTSIDNSASEPEEMTDEELKEAMREALKPAIDEAVEARSMRLTGRLPD